MVHLVTGSRGFLGRHLMAQLLARHRGDQVIGLVRPHTGKLGPHEVACDLEDPKALERVLLDLKPQRVYHLAGVSRVDESLGFEPYFFKNYLMSVHLLAACSKLTSPLRLFFASSIHVYGNQPHRVSEDSPVCPIGHYGFTKYLAEQALEQGARLSPPLQVVMGRLSSCVGPGQSSGFVLPDTCEKIKAWNESSGPFEVTNPQAHRQFVDVRDVVGVIIRLLEIEHPTPVSVFNIASKDSISIRQLVEQLIGLGGKTVRLKEIKPQGANLFSGLLVETNKLEKALGESFFRPLQETLKDSYNSAI